MSVNKQTNLFNPQMAFSGCINLIVWYCPVLCSPFSLEGFWDVQQEFSLQICSMGDMSVLGHNPTGFPDISRGEI